MPIADDRNPNRMIPRSVLRGQGSAELRRIHSAQRSTAEAESMRLNPEQLDVVLHGDGPCLVLAGAGSGKTRTIVSRVAHLLAQGVLPQEILLLTFTNKAAREMLSRIEALLGRGADGLWGGTFHHVANRILRRFAPLVGYRSSFSIMDKEDSVDILKLCVKDVGVATMERRFPSPSVLTSIISLSRNSQRELGDVLEDRHPTFARVAGEVEAVAARYAERKRMANAMDFDDLLVHLLRVLEQPGPRHALSEQFRFVLVDEYQDTNRIQAAIVERLASAHRNLCVVGDDAQSIYSFRAADVGNILRFPETFPGCRTFRITMNYRSTPEILAVANAAIAPNEAQFPKELRPVRAGGGRPILIRARTAAEEAQVIAQRILAFRDDGVSLSEIAVLFRATHCSEFLELELVKRDIPYDYRGGIRFFERAHIKDTLAFLRIIVNPADDASWLRVLRMQEGIGDVGAMRIIEHIRSVARENTPEGKKAQSAMDLSGDEERATTWIGADPTLPARLEKGWRSFLNMAKPLKGNVEPAALIRAIARGSYRDHLEASFPNWEERLEDLDQLALFAEQYTDLAAFLADTSLQDLFGAERVGPNANSQERIVLSTIHQAKGLEWHAVFVMGFTAAVFPNRRALLEDGGVEEERRLFYVAITRAKVSLVLSYALTGGAFSSFLSAPSPFLTEIPQELLDVVSAARQPSRGWGRDDREEVIRVDATGARVARAPTVAWKPARRDRKKIATSRATRGFLRAIEDL